MTEHEIMELHRLLEKAKQELANDKGTPEFIKVSNEGKLVGVIPTIYNGSWETWKETPEGVHYDNSAVY